MAHWSKDQVKGFAKGLRRDVGHAWRWLVPEVHEALAARHVLAIVLGQNNRTINIDDIEELLANVRHELQLDAGEGK